jgi:hypothetical protein
MLEGLSRDDERDITGTVHEVRSLHMAIGTVHKDRIGKEAFQYYPPTAIELSTFQQASTCEDTLLDG